jgi:segregation and condensation protein A
MPYAVQTSVFEGPFDLLLHLILREQVELYDVSLHTIIDGYLAEFDTMVAAVIHAEGSEDQSIANSGVPTIDLEIATEFLLIAATLIELKTRRLLPAADDGDLDEDFALWEGRDLLLARLLECKTFKNAASAMRGIADDAGLSFARTAGPDERFHELAPDLLAGVVAHDLRRAFLAAMAPKPVAKIDTFHIAPIRASVTDAVVELLEELPRVGRITFRALTGSMIERLDVVVRFLAVLELFKSGHVELEQIANFGDIIIEWTGESDDRPLELAVDSYEG